jgi:hypothetical protein
MDQDATGREFLAGLYESLRDVHMALYNQGFKVRALEYALRSFGNTRDLYDKHLADVTTPEVLQEVERSRLLYEATISAIRQGQFPQG